MGREAFFHTQSADGSHVTGRGVRRFPKRELNALLFWAVAYRPNVFYNSSKQLSVRAGTLKLCIRKIKIKIKEIHTPEVLEKEKKIC